MGKGLWGNKSKTRALKLERITVEKRETIIRGKLYKKKEIKMNEPHPRSEELGCRSPFVEVSGDIGVMQRLQFRSAGSVPSYHS